MILEDIKKSISKESGLSLTQNRSLIERNISIVMEDLDEMGKWHFTIQPYNLTVPAGSNKKSIAHLNPFRIVSCIATKSGGTMELDFTNLTDFKRLGTKFTTTNSNPDKYSLAGGFLWVGPGLLASATVINGDYRRRLTLDDVEQFPGSMIIDGANRRLTKKGTDVNIAARSGWNEWKRSMASKDQKITEEKRSVRFIDPQIAANIRYINSL